MHFYRHAHGVAAYVQAKLVQGYGVLLLHLVMASLDCSHGNLV